MLDAVSQPCETAPFGSQNISAYNSRIIPVYYTVYILHIPPHNPTYIASCSVFIMYGVLSTELLWFCVVVSSHSSLPPRFPATLLSSIERVRGVVEVLEGAMQCGREEAQELLLQVGGRGPPVREGK